MVFHWSLSDSKSTQVSRTRFRIVAVLSNAVIWIVSTCPPTSKSSRPFNYPWVIVPKAPITIGTIATFMFQNIFNSLARSRYLSVFSHSFRFNLWSAGTANSTILQILFVLLIIIRSGLLGGIRWSICILKSRRSLCVSFSRTDAVLRIHHLLIWSNLNFLHISQWITLPTHRVSPYTPSVLICCIRLLCDWSFRLCHCIAYIYWFVEFFYSRFDMIGAYGLVLCCYKERIRFSVKVSFT